MKNKSDDFMNRWGLDKNDPTLNVSKRHEYVKVAVLQFLSIALILYVIRPSCVLIKDGMHTVERFHTTAALAIAFIVTFLTLCRPLAQ